MNIVLGAVLPALVVYVMIVVGLELAPADFARVRRHPGALLVAIGGQGILLPLLAVTIARILSLPPATACGVVIIAAAPIAALSNYYALLARADVALAVTLTAVSSVTAAATMPFVIVLALKALGLDAAGFEPPLAKLLAQTIMGLLPPILLGMMIRRLTPGGVRRWRGRLQGFALAALAAIVAFVLTDQIEAVREQWPVLLVSALCYTVVALGIGLLVGRWVLSDTAGRRALLFGFPARNVAIATLIAVAMQGRTDVAAFGAVFFLVQVVLLVPLARLLAARPAIAGT